jgi:hypothetical protein
MTRTVLFLFVLYQIFTLPTGHSLIANGAGGSVVTAIALGPIRCHLGSHPRQRCFVSARLGVSLVAIPGLRQKEPAGHRLFFLYKRFHIIPDTKVQE